MPTRSSEEPPTSEFEKRCEYLKRLGVKYCQAFEYRGKPPNRERHDLEIFISVELPFTARQWAETYQRDGLMYIGGSGGIPELHSLISTAFYQNGHLSVQDLADMAELWNAYGEVGVFGLDEPDLEKKVEAIEETLRFIRRPESGEMIVNIWHFTSLVWDIVCDFYAPERAEARKRDDDGEMTIDDALSRFADAAKFIQIEDFVKRGQIEAAGPSSQYESNRLMLMARLVPMLKQVYEGISELIPESFVGVAIVKKDRPDDIVSNGRGLCVFKDRSEAQKIIDLYGKEESQYREGNHAARDRNPSTSYMIRPVEVTLEKGCVFL